MKNFYLAVITLLIFTSCKNETPDEISPDETLISGTATTDFINKPVYLKYIIQGSVITLVDTVSSDMKFEFRVSEEEYPLKAFLTNDLKDPAPKVSELNQLGSLIYFMFGSPLVPEQFGNSRDIKLFLLEKGHTKVAIEDSIYNASITGSALNDDLNKLSDDLESNMIKSRILNKTKITEETDPEIMESFFESSSVINHEKSKILDSFISRNKDSYASAYAFNLKPHFQKEDLEIFNQIDPEIRNSNLAETGRKKLEIFLNTAEVSDTVEDFMLPDNTGEQIALYDIKSKYILLDFWASWCAPCRKENAGITKYYSDFNRDDFQIVGISVDTDTDKWLEALKDDKITWMSLLDKGSDLSKKLGVASYPTNFLLDSDYKIIDKNLRADNLKERIDQLIN